MMKFVVSALVVLLVLALAGVDEVGVVRQLAGGQASTSVVTAPKGEADAAAELRWALAKWSISLFFSALLLAGALAAIGAVTYWFVIPAINALRFARDPEYHKGQVVTALTKRTRGLTNAEAAYLSGVHEAIRGKAEYEAEGARVKAERQRVLLEDVQRRTQPPEMRQWEGPVGSPMGVMPVQFPPSTFREALAQSRGWSYRKAEIVIGQAGPEMEGDGGRLATIDLTVNPFVMISGKPNSGKTKGVGFTLVAGVLQWGWPVVVFEPGNKRDWKKIFGEHVIHHNLNAENCMVHLEMLEAEYKRRAQLLQQHGFIEWNESEASARLCPPVLIVMEELGTTLKRIALRGEDEKKGQARERMDAFTVQLSILVLEARASGMFMLAIQQRPVDYPSDLLASFTHIVYKLGGIGQGTAVGSPRNHLLAEQGEFDMGVASRTRSKDGSPLPVLFQSYDTKYEIGEFLAAVHAPPKPAPLLPCGCCEAIWAPQTVEPAARPKLAARSSTSDAWAESAPKPAPWSQALREAGVLYVTQRKWDAFAEAWCKANPNGVTPAHLARVMAELHNQHFPNDLKDWKVNFYSQARRLFARYHPTGEPSRVDGVTEQIERDRAKERQLGAAPQAGRGAAVEGRPPGAVATLRRDEVVRPKFM